MSRAGTDAAGSPGASALSVVERPVTPEDAVEAFARVPPWSATAGPELASALAFLGWRVDPDAFREHLRTERDQKHLDVTFLDD